MITRDQPYSTAYDLYGDPNKLVEFRVFSLNSCSMDCRGCFYKRDDNSYDDFSSMLHLAQDMQNNGYKLETCYILPTDIFDNPDNYQLFDDYNFSETLKLFSYVGVAATLEEGYRTDLFNYIYNISPDLKVELQVNLVIQRLPDINYMWSLKHHINNLKDRYGDRIVINLAINTGFSLSQKEEKTLKRLIMNLSEDGIVELNFTFLYNDDINFKKKTKMLKESLNLVNIFGEYYKTDSSYVKQFNNRTFLDKPSFSFLGSPNRIYTNPIIPFDEYVFIHNDKYLLDEPSFMGFLQSYGAITEMNFPILSKCESCDNLTYCMGKHYFAIAREFGLTCILDEQTGE